MKALVCEMCSGNDFVKQDGFFVCQSCGTKYTVEEAKKIMIEGTVDVHGTVKVDNSAQIETYLANARRAKSKEDWEEVEKYYNMAEQFQPENIEAVFYSSYAKAKRSLIVNDINQREAVFNTFIKTISIIDDIFDVEKRNELKTTIKTISDEIISMCGSRFVYKETENGHKTFEKDRTYGFFNKMNREFINTLNEIIKKYGSEYEKETVYIYELIIKHIEFCTEAYGSAVILITNKFKYEDCIYYAGKLKEIDPSAEVKDYRTLIEEKERNLKANQRKNTLGCLIGIIVVAAIVFIITMMSI